MGSKRTRNTKFKNGVQVDVQLHILANEEPPMAAEMLKTFYNATFQNQIGLMYAKNIETGKVEGILVGLAVDGDDFNCFPLAKVLTSDEAINYLAPDREGGWQSMITGEPETVIEESNVDRI